MATPIAPLPESPFGAAPSADDFYAQNVQAYEQQAPRTDAASEALADEVASPALPPIALPAGAPAGAGIPTVGEQSDGRVYVYDGDKPYAMTPEQLAARKEELGHFIVPTVSPDGDRRGVAVRDLDRAVAQGYKVEGKQETDIQRILSDNKGLKGDALALAHGYSNQIFQALPDIVGKHTEDPYERAWRERLLSEHEFADNVGSAAGLAASIFVGGPIFKGAALAGGAAEQGLARVLTARAAAAGLEGAAPTIGAKIARSAVRLGAESAVLAAPAAVTEAALGDPKEAAESLAIALGAGAVLGSFGAGARALVERVFGDIPGLGFGKATAASKAEADAVGTTAGDLASFDEKLAASGPKGAAEVEAARGAGTKAVDATGEAFINAQKSLGQDEKNALTRVLKSDAGNLGKQEEILDDAARAWKKVGDVAMHVDDEVLPKIAFGEGKAKQMAALVDPSKWEAASSVVNQTYKRVEEVVTELEGLSDKGGSAGAVKRMRTALDAFEQKALWARKSGQPDAEIVRDSYMYLDKLKRDIGKSAAMGSHEGMRNFTEKAAFDLYHEILPALESEAAWGPAGVAQREVNQATTAKLGMSQKFKQSFITDFEKRGGNAINEFEAGDIKSYLRNVLGAENDSKEKALRGWVTGLRDQMSAVEKHYTLSAAEKTEFATAREALSKFETGIQEAKDQAKSIALIKRMQEDERGKAIGGIAGLAIDFFTRPMTVIERANQARQFTQRAEKAGILITEQAQKKTGGQLDGIGKTILALGAGAAAEKIAARGSAAIGIEGASQLSRQDHFKALSKQLADAQADAAGTDKRVSGIAAGIAQGGAPNVAAALASKQKQVLDYLAREMPRGPAPVPFGPRKDYLPTERELHAYERKREAAYDPVGTIERNLARGTLTRDHIETVRELYPAILGRIAERVARAAAAPNAPVLSRTQRARLALLFGSPMAKPADAARYQAPYAAGPPQGQPSGAGLDKMPSPQTETQRISGA